MSHSARTAWGADPVEDANGFFVFVVTVVLGGW